MARETPQIDWRSQLDELEPYLDGQGGIISVKYHGENSAPNAFVEILTSLFDKQSLKTSLKKQVAASIRIDRSNYKVRYLSGIRAEFSRKLKKELPSPISNTGASIGEMLSNNTAGGNQTISNTLNIGVSETELQVGRDKWISALCKEMANFLTSNRFMIVLSHGTDDEQDEFWNQFWSAGMSDLIADGLVLVRMIDVSAASNVSDFRGSSPDLIINLRPELNEQQVAHATEDVASLLYKMKSSDNKIACQYIAQGYVIAKKDNVRALRDGLLELTKLVQSSS